MGLSSGEGRGDLNKDEQGGDKWGLSVSHIYGFGRRGGGWV